MRGESARGVLPCRALKGRHALSMPEDVVGIKGRLDLAQPRQIGTPVCLRPVREVEIAVIHVSPARYVGTHGGIEVSHVRKMRRGVPGIRPLGKVLNAELRAGAMRERRSVASDAPDGAAIG